MRLGIDLGGTKIEIIALDDDGTTLARERVSTPVGDYDGTIRSIGDLVRGVEGRLGRAGTIGIAMPGAFSARTGLVKNANSVVLNGRPLDRDIEAHLGRAVRMENDANCLALSEAVDGAAAGHFRDQAGEPRRPLEHAVGRRRGREVVARFEGIVEHLGAREIDAVVGQHLGV